MANPLQPHASALAARHGAEALTALSSAERQVALLQRCIPWNLEHEIDRVSRRLSTGLSARFQFQYRPAPALGNLRRGLAVWLESPRPDSKLVAARAEELSLEAAMVEERGRPRFRHLAARRFDLDELVRHTTPAGNWLQLDPAAPPATERAERIPSDSRDPASLVSQLQRLVGELRLPFRVCIAEQLQSVAAVGANCIWVRVGTPLTAQESRRIAVHEVRGHAVRWARGSTHPALLARIGFARSVEDEEGWAVWQEERHGLLHTARRRELALRHTAAANCYAGQDLAEVVSALRRHGMSVASAVRTCARVLRGGGLFREAVYLPHWMRVSQALQHEPSLEAVMQTGRLSLESATAELREDRQRRP